MSATKQSRPRTKTKAIATHSRVNRQTVAEERLYQIILKPLVSEKSTRIADKNNQAVFQVRTDASKEEIRQAVEKLFTVKVKSVQVVNVRGKAKSFGRIAGMRKNWKKAYVCLQEGQEIDFLGMTGA